LALWVVVIKFRKKRQILRIISKFIMILLMYIGRVGSLSFAFAFVQNKTKPKIIQPKESISIG